MKIATIYSSLQRTHRSHRINAGCKTVYIRITTEDIPMEHEAATTAALDKAKPTESETVLNTIPLE